MYIDELRLAVGQLLIGGFHGQDPTPEVIQALHKGHLGGVVLFRRNIDTLPQLVDLNAALHAAARPIPPWVAVDQEGGPVRRLTEAHGATFIPAMRALGQTQNVDLAAQVSEVIATELQALGFNLNFAPVLDIDTNPQNPIIGPRAFSHDPEQVARMAGAFMVGHLIAGVAPCGKHFPGHGDTATDSHKQLPVLMHSIERLHAVELLPFRRLIAGGLSLIMTGHLLLPALDAVLPATLSHAVVTGLLRDNLGFEGVIVSDDLEMAAITAHHDIEDTICLGLRAGIDLFLICSRSDLWHRAYDALLRLGTDNPEDRTRILQAAERVCAAKAAHFDIRTPWLPSKTWAEVVGCPAHQATISKIVV